MINGTSLFHTGTKDSHIATFSVKKQVSFLSSLCSPPQTSVRGQGTYSRGVSVGPEKNRSPRPVLLWAQLLRHQRAAQPHKAAHQHGLVLLWIDCCSEITDMMRHLAAHRIKSNQMRINTLQNTQVEIT